MDIILLRSAGPGGLIFIVLIIVAILFVVMRSKDNDKKATPAATAPNDVLTPVSTPKKKRKTLEEARAEGIKEGLELARQNSKKGK